jgi:hypothetical protein
MNVRRNVIFRSTAFNTTEPKDYFINDCCFGDDLARWLIEQLNARGVPAGPEPAQEDFGWYLRYQVNQIDYDFVITFREGEGALSDWIGTIERRVGFWASILGGRKHGIQLDAADAIHTALTSSPLVTNVLWYTDEDCRTEQNGQESPTGN